VPGKILWSILGLYFSCLAQVQVEELGRFGGTGSTPGLFKNPSAVQITQNGRIVICDRDNHRLQIFDPGGNFIKDIGGFGAAVDQFDQPRDVWAGSALSIFVADYNNRRVQRYDKDFNFINSFISNPGEDDRFQFREVSSVIYSPRGDMFILDHGEKKVVKFNPNNKPEVAFAYYESGAGELDSPVQLDLTGDYRLLISDAAQKAVFVYDYYGNFIQKIEYPRFKAPSGLAVDQENRIYVCDPACAAIYIFTGRGIFLDQIETIGGIRLRFPSDLALVGRNNRYQLAVIDQDQVIIASLQYGLPPD
jgi:tripartite motif-containing protein 71